MSIRIDLGTIYYSFTMTIGMFFHIAVGLMSGAEQLIVGDMLLILYGLTTLALYYNLSELNSRGR